MHELTVYTKWEDIPSGMATKTTLGKRGLKLAPDQQPVAQKKRYDQKGRHVGYYDLYAAADAIPKKKATAAQMAALEKARHMAEKVEVTCCKCGDLIVHHYRRYSETWTVTRKQYQNDQLDKFVCHLCEDRTEAREWAVNLLEYGDFVILDTETADLHGEIIEIAIIDQDGKTLLDQRIKPQGEIAPGAEAVHGISLDDLKDAPSFAEVYPAIVEAIAGKPVIIYNAQYDVTCLQQDCRRHELAHIGIESACAMEWYSQWYGEWSSHHGNYRLQPLNGGHAALGDCLATLECIQEMAGVDVATEA
jgi:DNA polymerase-3 subunit epsilon